jgi:hypothetical protein
MIEPIEKKRKFMMKIRFCFTLLSVVAELFPSGTSVLGVVADLFFDFLLVDFVVELAVDSG